MAQPQFIDSLLPGNPVFIAVTLNLNYLLFRYFQYAFHLDDYFRFGAKVRKILTLSYTCCAGRFPIYEMLHIVSISLTDTTNLKDLFAKPNYNIVNELDGSTEPSLFELLNFIIIVRKFYRTAMNSDITKSVREQGLQM